MLPVLRAENLTIARGRARLLDGLSLAVGPREIVRLVGLNGSGKSSLLRVLAGVVEPRRGKVWRHLPCVYAPDPVELSSGLAPDFFQRLCQTEAELPTELSHACGKLSKGQLKRMLLIGALASVADQAAVLLLDEPWSGLDLGSCAWLDRALTSAVERGSSVVFVDHAQSTKLAVTRVLAVGATDGLAETQTQQAIITLRRAGGEVEVKVDSPVLAQRISEGWRIVGGRNAR